MDPLFLEAHVRSIWPDFDASVLRSSIARLMQQGCIVIGYRFHLDRNAVDQDSLAPRALAVTKSREEAAILTWMAYTFQDGLLSDFCPVDEPGLDEMGVLNPDSTGTHYWGTCVMPRLRLE